MINWVEQFSGGIKLAEGIKSSSGNELVDAVAADVRERVERKAVPTQ